MGGGGVGGGVRGIFLGLKFLDFGGDMKSTGIILGGKKTGIFLGIVLFIGSNQH